jgi:gliding motility-associated-like protein
MKKILYLIFCFLLTLSLNAADYYWIGGSGSWSNISNWATTSGGVVTHNTAPSAEDNVIFDANSFTAPNQVVSLDGDIAFCRDMRWETGTQGAIFSAAATATLNVFGGLALSAEMNFDFQGNVRFQGNNPGSVIDMAGQNFLRDVTFEGTGAAWSLSSNLQATGTIFFFSGQLVSNGSNIICERFYASIYSNGALLDLNQSTITLTGIDQAFTATPYTLAIIGGTSNYFALEQAEFILNGSQATYRHSVYGLAQARVGAVNFRSETGNANIVTDASLPLNLGKLDIQNNALIRPELRLDSLILGGGKQFEFQAGSTVRLDFLSVEGTCEEPVLLQSNESGRFVNFISNTGPVMADFVSIQDIHASGAATFTANNAVDLGNNNGWTINSKSYSELYWVGGTGMWDDPANWSFTSGGPGGACIPTPGEDVIFDANSFANVMDIVMINVENAYCRDMRWEGPIGMPSINGSMDENLRVFGSLDLSPAMTFAFEGDMYFQGQTQGQTITTANQTFQKDVTFSGSGGWILQDSLKLLQDLYFQSGYLNTNDQAVNLARFFSQEAGQRRLELTNSTISLDDRIRFFYLEFDLQTDNLTFDAGTSTIAFQRNGGIEVWGTQAVSFHKVVNYTAGYHDNRIDPVDQLTIDTLELFAEAILYNNHHYTKNLIINAGFDLRITERDTLSFDTIIVRGGCGQFAEIRSNTVGIPVNIVPTRPNTVSDVILQDLHNNTGISLQAENAVDLGNNVGLDFMELAGRDLYWVGDGGEWNDPIHWSLSSGGPGGACPPGPNDNVYFDANSFSQPNQSVNGATFSYCRNMDWTGANFVPRLNYYAHQQYGALTFIEQMSTWGNYIRFRTDSTSVRVETAGQFTNYVIFEGNGSWQIIDSLDVFYFEYLAGGLSTREASVVVERFSVSKETPKTLDMRNSRWYFDGREYEGNIWYVGPNSLDEVLADSSVVDFRSDNPVLRLYDSFTFDRLIASNTAGNTRLTNYLNNLPLDSVTFRELDLRNNTVFEGSMYGDTILLAAGKTYQLDPFGVLRGEAYIQMIGNNCTPIELRSRINGQQADLVSPRGVVKADFVQMQDIRAVGEELFYAGVHSTDIGNNTNWIFDSAEEFVEEGFLGQDKVLCEALSLTLDANNFSPGETYRWQDGSTDSIFVVDQAGLYFVEVTFTNNCSIRDSVNVLPPNDFTPNLPDTLNLLCEGDTLLLDASLDLVGLTYLWQDSTTASTFPVTENGEYKVTLELGGCTASDSTRVQLVAYPVVDLGADQTLCADSTFMLDASTDTATYRWSDNSTLPTFEVNSPGIYWADVSYGKCTTRDSVNISYYDPILLDLGNDTTICEDRSIMINGGLANATYTWSDGSSGNSILVSMAGTYGVEALVNGCPAYDSIDITIQELPRFELGGDTAICAGESLLLDGTSLPGATYEWSDGSTDPTLSVSAAGVYALQTRLNGCTFADTRTLSIKPLPVVDLGPDEVLCEEDQQLLDVSQPTATYQWQDGSTEGTLLVEMAGTYSVEVNLDGCTLQDSIRFDYKPLPRFELGADTAICAGELLVLDGTSLPGATYTWSDGSDGARLTVNSEGTYALQASLDGCVFSDARSISIKPLPVVDLGADQVRCEGDMETLDVNQDNATYEWQDGSTMGTFEVAQSGTFGVRINLEGCTASDSVDFVFNPAPRFDLGNDTLLCTGETLRLNGFVNATTTYNWNNGANTAGLTVNTPGIYNLTASDNGCTFSDEITVTYGIIPDDLLGMDRVLCEEEVLNFNLNVPNASAYEWIDGQISSDYLITEVGTYGVRVSVGRCFGGDTINVSYNPLPRFDLGNDTLLCEGATLNLEVGTFADSYQWQDGTTAANYSVRLPGTYAATATLDGCSFTDERVVDYQASRSFSLGPDTTICEEEVFFLSVDQRADRIEWQDGSTNRNFSVQEAGNYSVVVVDGACTFSDSITIATRECFRFRVYAPTAFSPNGDGVNDEFGIAIPPNIEVLSYEMDVFDRWGNRVFTSGNINEGWNGLLNGQDLATGVYLYSIHIRYRDDFREDEEIVSGDVLLIR